MNIPRFSPGIATLAIAALFSVFPAGCERPPSHQVQGYIEGEFLYIASPFAGDLEQLPVRRGAAVKSGDLLFVLESTREETAVTEAKRRLAQSKATLNDARKGARPSELAAANARVNQARAALELSEMEMARQEQLLQVPGATSEQIVDRARSTHNQNLALLSRLEAELETARLGARSDQIAAAEENTHALEAALARAEWELSQKQQTAPESGRIYDTLYQEGEWVSGGKPVIVLLPPKHVKLRTFVPQSWLSSIQPGDPVQVRIDGAESPVSGKISFISPRAEYTPPVIYSRENRRKFVFLVEAVFEPEIAARMHPGQPVDVHFSIKDPP